MKENLISLSIICLFTVTSVSAQKADYPIQQVKLNSVELTDNFWLPKIRTVQEKTITYAFKKCEEEGRLENFVTAGDVIRGKVARGVAKARGKMVFDDTDVYKTIEGAAYTLINAPNSQLSNYLDSIINIIAYGQEPDGYLTTWRTIDPKNPTSQWVKSGGGRWFHLGMSHELYNAGHLYEAAAAHYWATGKRNFLEIALKNADLLVKTFMLSPVNNLHLEFPGHQIVETGLIKLYQITGKEDYLRLAKQFLDNRGKTDIQGKEAYRQDHKPVVEQDEAVGHAVRAVYMYAGMTDIAAIYGDSAYRMAVDKLWENVVSKKMYITGGLGALHKGEAFGANYELPNKTAYAETCAAIGGVYWNERMFRQTGDAKYINVLERMLYNGVISGISHAGTEFFYPNPLESDGIYKFNQGHLTRAAWFDCSCCPTNLIRFIPYIPNLIYATQDNSLYVNLFIANKAKISLENGTVEIQQKTDYPWTGKVEMTVNLEKQEAFTLKIRVPSWAQNRFDSDLYHYANEKSKQFSIKINGKTVTGSLQQGYFEITRTWNSGDKISIDFPMEIRTVEANPLVKDDAGKVAVEYGALVYCLEKPKDDKSAFPAFLNKNQVLEYKNLTLIPYYSWANRGVAEMKVWLEK
jgi:DUF1680 family protein